MTDEQDPIEACEQRRQQIATAVERLEAAANAWRKFNRMMGRDAGDYSMQHWELKHAIDELARLRGEG